MTDATEVGRKLRVKERKTYTDIDLDDDEIDGKRSYTLDEKLKSTKYNRDYVQILRGEDFNLNYVQENGLEYPIVFYEKSGLGLRVPSENFKVCDVKQCVGSRRMLDVMDVNTQKGMEMSMREWVQYYESDQRKRLLNVISLEFSHTKLENYVESPNIVRQIDWVDTVWPRHLKECQTESTNIIEKMKYPKVQKYCLMSVQGCYTDFHIDFGGTSVWYHILHGHKVFWLIPPTERNVEIYTNWVLSAKQGDVFLADQVEGCQRIDLQAGYTFIIPSGWIHAVFTPKDSLVFGGNFLHCYNIVNQLRVSDIEDKTHVPQKFRYPFYTEIAWYVLARYITCITGKQCLETPAEDKENGEDKRELSPFIQDESRPSSRCSQDNDYVQNKSDTSARPSTPKLSKSVTIELTRIDQSPLSKSVSDDESVAPRWPHSPRKSSSDSCSSADTEIYEKPEDILGLVVSNGTTEKNGKGSARKQKSEGEGKKGDHSVQKKVYRNSAKKEAKTVYLTKCQMEGLQLLLEWLEALPPSKRGVPKDMINPEEVLSDMKQLLQDHASDDQSLACSGEPILVWPASKKPTKVKTYKSSSGLKTPKSQSSKGSPSTGVRRRRTRCRKCEPCTRTDCGECNFCKDMKKYGGPGRMKQSCKSRQCLAPVLPNAATCMICGKDDRIKSHDNPEETVTTLMECGICWEIVHPECLKNKYENLDNEGVINEDVPNSWECPKCCHDGKQGQLKPRVLKIKKEPSMKTPEPESPLSPGEYPPVEVKVESEGKRVTSKQSIPEKEEDVKMESDTEEEAANHSNDDTATCSPISPPVPKMSRKKTEKSPPKHIVKPKEKRSPLKLGKYGKLSPKGRLSLSPKKSPKVMVKGKSTGTLVKSLSSIQKRPSRFSPLDKSGSSDTSPESVTTRSGRKVKRSPQLSDENIETDMPRKRPRRECLVSRPEVTKRNGVKVTRGQGVRSTSVHLRTRRIQSPGTSNSEELSESPERQRYSLKRSVYGSGQQKSQLYKSKSTPPLGQSSKKKKLGSEKKSLSEIRIDKTQQARSETVSGQGHLEGRDGAPKLKLNRFVVRPTAPPPPPDCVETEGGVSHPLKRQHWTKIFTFLNYRDLARCLSVSTTFNRWGMNHLLWREIDLSRKRICQPHLIGIVKRQPAILRLSNVIMTQNQLSWLIARIPQLKDLSLSSCSWATVSALCFSSCPLLRSLNLNWILGMNQQCFKDLVSPPSDLRPGMQEISRLHRLKSLFIAGTEIGDESLGCIAQYLVQLEELDISFCQRVTDKGLKILVSSNNGTIAKTLKSLDISGSRHLTDACLEYLAMCENLTNVKMVKCPLIALNSIANFPKKSVLFVK